MAERRKLVSKALFNSKKSYLQRHVELGNVDSDKQDRESLIDNDVPTGRRCSRSGQSALTASQFCLLTFLHICVSCGLYLSKGTITSELPRFSLLRRKADCHTSLPTRSRQSGGTITSAVLPSTSSISDSQRTSCSIVAIFQTLSAPEQSPDSRPRRVTRTPTKHPHGMRTIATLYPVQDLQLLSAIMMYR